MIKKLSFPDITWSKKWRRRYIYPKDEQIKSIEANMNLKLQKIQQKGLFRQAHLPIHLTVMSIKYKSSTTFYFQIISNFYVGLQERVI